MPSWALSDIHTDVMIETTFDGESMAKSVGKMTDITGDTGFFLDAGKNGMCLNLKTVATRNGIEFTDETTVMQISYGNQNGFCGGSGSSSNSIQYQNTNHDQYIKYSFFTLPSVQSVHG